MEINFELSSHKKVLLFGSEGTGKSTLSTMFERGKYVPNLEHTLDG